MTSVPLDYLLSLVNPLKDDVWGCGELVTLEMISSAPPEKDKWNKNWPIKRHAGRIRYLAESTRFVPIGLDVGILGLSHHEPLVYDGHHRLVSAVYCGCKEVPCEIDGTVGYIDELIANWRENGH